MKDYEIINKYWFFEKSFYFECNNGWNLLIDELCSKINLLIEKKYPELKNEEFPFIVLQIKEKYGTLRFYTGSANEEIFDLIDEYEKKSAFICELCGEPGTIKDIGGSWLKCVCNKHLKEITMENM